MKKSELINMLVDNGYKVYESSNKGEKHDWLFTLTPDNSILYIQPEKLGGYKLSYQYQPSRETGTGCSCNDDAIDINSIEQMQKLGRSGKDFARQLKVKRYWDSWEQFANKHWSTLTEYTR